MGDLYLAGGPDTVSKGIISMWFRVPSESAAAAFSRYDKWQNGPLGRAYDKDPYGAQDPPPLLGILPLMTFGPIGSAPRFTYGNGTQYVQASQGYAAYIDVGNPSIFNTKGGIITMSGRRSGYLITRPSMASYRRINSSPGVPIPTHPISVWPVTMTAP